MEVKKVILGANPLALIDKIPDECVTSRTITLNKLKVLQIFKDRRPNAITWIEANIPRLIILDPAKKQKLVNWFWSEMPNDSWLEFDFGTKVLSLCILKKK